MMNEEEILIDKILKANRLEDVIDVSNMKKEFNSIILKIHTDRCHAPRAGEASTRLIELRDSFNNGISYEDEAGKFTIKGTEIKFERNTTLHTKSFDNYQRLKAIKDGGNFQKYMPTTLSFVDKKLTGKFFERAVPIVSLKTPMPQVHVNWIYSRMLEFCAWIAQNGYTHCGINPESVCIMPANHGIQVSTYYMMAKTGARISGISGKYQSWYPPELFANKQADPSVDLELCAKTAIYLLGDPSGIGVKLKRDKNVNQKILDFLISKHEDPGNTWKEYREVLSSNFKKEFHILNV